MRSVYNGAKVPARFTFEGEVVTLQPRHATPVSDGAAAYLEATPLLNGVFVPVVFYYGKHEVPREVIAPALLGTPDPPAPADAMVPPSPPADPCGAWDTFEAAIHEKEPTARLKFLEIVTADLLPEVPEPR